MNSVVYFNATWCPTCKGVGGVMETCIPCKGDGFVKSEVTIKEIIDGLSDNYRLELFSNYCMWCGTSKLPCYCMRED